MADEVYANEAAVAPLVDVIDFGPPISHKDVNMEDSKVTDSGLGVSIGALECEVKENLQVSDGSSDLHNSFETMSLQSTDSSNKTHSKENTESEKCKENEAKLKEAAVKLLQTNMQAQWQKFHQQTMALFLFARTGDVRVLLAELWSLFSLQNDDGDTPLHTAILSENPQVVTNFLTTASKLKCLGNSLDLRNNLGQTPLMLSVITGQHNIFNSLLKCNADPSLVDTNGNNVVHLAIKNWRDGRCLRILTENMKQPHTDSRLLQTLQQYNYNGLTPCHMAISSGRVTCLQMLLKVDSTIAEQEDAKSGMRSLHFAVEAGSLPMIGELLLQANVDVDSQTFTGYTPLHLAVLKRNYTIAALLISADADPNVPLHEQEAGTLGQTAFDMAKADEKMLSTLKGHGSASVNSDRDSEEGKFLTSHTHLSAQASGDMQLLPHSARYRIAAALNQDKQVRWQLCEVLRLHLLFRVLETTDSPALAILDSFEAIGGCMRDLHAALKKLRLFSAAQEVLDCLNKAKGPVPKQSQVSELDSGLFSSSNFSTTF